jgi:Ni/Fe-hydrogenase subunit HybB-like protein
MRIKIIKELREMPKFVYVLAALMAFGGAIGVYRLYAGLGATTDLSKAYPWGIWISFDLSTVALSGGAFTLAALVYVLQMHNLHAAVRPTVLAGLLGYSSVLIILFMDLGRWDRAYHFLIYPNLNSALFEVSWCIALYSSILIYELSPVLLAKSRWSGLIPIIEKYTIPMVIAGVSLSSLHQSSLGTLFIVMSPRLHALWHSMLLPVFFLVSSLASGLGLVIAGAGVSYWVFKRTLPERVLAKLGWFLPWVLGLYLVLKLGELEIVGELNLLFTSGKYSILFLTELVIGVIAPIILFSFKNVRHNRVASMLSAFLVMGGVILNRFDASWFAIKPIAGEVYSPHWMEVAILIGVVSGVFLAYTLVGRYFPLFEETVEVKEARQPVLQPQLQPIPAAVGEALSSD